MRPYSREFAFKVLAQNNLSDIVDLNPFGNDLTLVTFMRYLIGSNNIQMVDSENLNDTSEKQLGFSLKEMLLSCSYNLLICNLSDFTLFYDSVYGSCYRFKSDALYSRAGN
jgi:hypothetical protein